MAVIDHYLVLTARSALAIWVGLSWLLVWQVDGGASVGLKNPLRAGASTD